MARIRKTSVGVPQFIEERLAHCIDGRESLGWCILQQGRNQINGIRRGLSENLVEWMRLDLRELVLHVVGIHRSDLITSWGTKDLDNLDELVDTRLAGEKRLTQHQLSHNTAS